MLFKEIVTTLNARVIHKSSSFDNCVVESVIVSDLMSDVLVLDEHKTPVLLTSLASDQALRTASMIDVVGVIIAQNKPLPEGIEDLAAELDITLLHTAKLKFESCVILGELMKK